MVDWFFGSCPSKHLDSSWSWCVQANSSHRNDLMTCDQPIGRDNQPTSIAVEIERARERLRKKERERWKKNKRVWDGRDKEIERIHRKREK